MNPQPEPVEYVRAPREPSEATVQRAIKHMLNASIGVDYRWSDYARDLYRIMVAEAQPEPVADAGGVVERAIKDLQRRFPSWSPTPLMLGYARAVGAEVARSLLAQVESLKAERDDLQAEAGTQALTIRRLTQEREEARDLTSASVTVGYGLSVYGSMDALLRVQNYILLDSEHPVEKDDVRRSLARALQAAESALATEREAKARMVEALRGALEDIAHRSMFSDKDAIVRHARSALQRTGGSDA